MQIIETTTNQKETKMKPDFMNKIANIIAEARNRTSMDEAEVKILKELLQEELKEYYDALEEYYEEEYYIAIEDVRTSAYDNGYADGYTDGSDEGYSENNS